jgi:3-dehydroquinate synthetase
MTKYDMLVEAHGTLEQFKEAINNAKDCYFLTDDEVSQAIEKYRLDLEEAAKLDSKVVSIDDLKKVKSKRNRDKIVKQLIDHANNLKW